MNHAKILLACMGQLSLNELQAIQAANEKCWQAQQQWGMGAQIACQNQMDKIVHDIYAKKMPYAKDIISICINKAIQEDA